MAAKRPYGKVRNINNYPNSMLDSKNLEFKVHCIFALTLFFLSIHLCRILGLTLLCNLQFLSNSSYQSLIPSFSVVGSCSPLVGQFKTRCFQLGAGEEVVCLGMDLCIAFLSLVNDKNFSSI